MFDLKAAASTGMLFVHAELDYDVVMVIYIDIFINEKKLYMRS